MSTLRPVHYTTLVRVFERDGFRFDRQRGDHLIFVKPGVKRPLVIPAYEEIRFSLSRIFFARQR
jgi:predicted RNA binding protein YcfA (HicA-like mRNA interferase family)